VGPEGCDDGNAADGDGCAGDCTVEPFFACVGEPSMCHCVVYVDQAGVVGPRTGASWTEGLATVQQGVDAASAACEVWVADGVYFIRQGSDGDTVSLKSNVSVYGGFAGGESQLDQRNWLQNATVLHGANPAQTERVYHVVTAVSVQGALLDGFTVTQGNAKWGRHGGGVYIEDSTVTLSQLRVEDNTADINGGGIYAWDSTVTLAHSIIQGNDANYGGGVSVERESVLTVARCRFLDNQADYHGGGLRVYDHASATVTSSLFVDNQVVYNFGGAIVNWSMTDLTLINCTLYRNHANISAGAIRNLSADRCTVRNSILWGNTPNAFDGLSTTVTLSHTIMQDSGWAGSNGNLGGDPLLLLPGFDLDPSSPAIDSADDAYAPATDLGGNGWVDIPGVGTVGTLADRGCFEYVP
jgi:cysteine-rich repeat protein